MKPYVLSQIPEGELVLFKKVCHTVDLFPDNVLLTDQHGKKMVLSCHILARAVGKAFRLECQDGYFHPFYEHSWLVTSTGNVIDVYPVGILGGPILVHQNHNFTSPVKHLYEPSIDFMEKLTGKNFLDAVKIVQDIIASITHNNGLL